MDQINPLPALTQDEVRVGAWAEVREPLELQLAPLGRRGLAALAPHPGESLLDIGCGGGETALDLVRAVAPDGTVVGVDLSAAVLAFAQRAAKGCERVRFVQADAQVFPFEPASFDAAFSRFGVMFFADPTAAFINIRRSLRPNGRLAFVCWRALEENQLDILPLRAGSAHLPPQPAHDPDAPGPFACRHYPRALAPMTRSPAFKRLQRPPRTCRQSLACTRPSPASLNTSATARSACWPGSISSPAKSMPWSRTATAAASSSTFSSWSTPPIRRTPRSA